MTLKCPKCGSTEYVKYGFTRLHEQKYKCKQCQRLFIESSQNTRDITKKSFPIPNLSVLFPEPLTVDSIRTVPCFVCDLQVCEPSTCERLSHYVMNDLLHEDLK